MRILYLIVLILFTGYLSAFSLFADSIIWGILISISLYIAGSAGVGALYAKRWQLSALCSWGALLMAGLEIGYRIGKEPISGAQPMAQVLLVAFGALGLAMAGGYLGSWLRSKKIEKNA